MAAKSGRRPVKNLYLPGIHFPVGAIVSALHRISGVLLVLAFPGLLWLLQQSLTSDEEYRQVVSLLQSPSLRMILFVYLILAFHHLFAGIRHLLLDIDIGISRCSSRWGAWMVLGGVMAVALLAGARLIL